MSAIVVISGFPGVGKSWLFRSKRDKLRIVDSDSSKFSWLDPVNKVRNPYFIRDYMEHIKGVMKENEVVLVSSHKTIREALYKEGINYLCVYPTLEQKGEYLSRYRGRGGEGFVKLLEDNYDTWIKEIDNDPLVINKIKIQGYLSDLFV